MTTGHNELRALALDATPGPWQAQQRNKQEAIYIVGPDHTPPACHAFYANNADYIAAAHPATVLALLDDLEAAHTARREAQARVAELTEQVQKMRVHLHRNTAAAMNDPSARWYVIDKRGFATLCLNWEDARDTAREADQAYPDNAPHACGWMSVADMEGGAV